MPLIFCHVTVIRKVPRGTERYVTVIRKVPRGTERYWRYLFYFDEVCYGG